MLFRSCWRYRDLFLCVFCNSRFSRKEEILINPNLREGIVLIGEIVKVKVDRPLGSYHPEHKDMYYSINYGYIEGVFASDGEEQDAYIIGVDEPVKEFVGKIVAVIHRKDDVEEKWVVAPHELYISKEQIWDKVMFTEQYFDSEIIM